MFQARTDRAQPSPIVIQPLSPSSSQQNNTMVTSPLNQLYEMSHNTQRRRSNDSIGSAGSGNIHIKTECDSNQRTSCNFTPDHQIFPQRFDQPNIKNESVDDSALNLLDLNFDADPASFLKSIEAATFGDMSSFDLVSCFIE